MSLDARALNLVTIEQPGSEKMLRKKADPVHFPLSKEDKDLIAAMKEKLLAIGGVGLAAPQVNYSRQIIVIYIAENAAALRDDAEPQPLHVLINARYTPLTKKHKINDFEGCFSVKNKAGKVPRYETIRLVYEDENGQRHDKVVHGFYARVVQHEIDHTEGLLIVDRLTADCIQGTPEQMMELRRSTLAPEKKALYDQIVTAQQIAASKE